MFRDREETRARIEEEDAALREVDAIEAEAAVIEREIEQLEREEREERESDAWWSRNRTTIRAVEITVGLAILALAWALHS